MGFKGIIIRRWCIEQCLSSFIIFITVRTTNVTKRPLQNNKLSGKWKLVNGRTNSQSLGLTPTCCNPEVGLQQQYNDVGGFPVDHSKSFLKIINSIFLGAVPLCTSALACATCPHPTESSPPCWLSSVTPKKSPTTLMAASVPRRMTFIPINIKGIWWARRSRSLSYQQKTCVCVALEVWVQMVPPLFKY